MGVSADRHVQERKGARRASTSHCVVWKRCSRQVGTSQMGTRTKSRLSLQQSAESTHMCAEMGLERLGIALGTSAPSLRQRPPALKLWRGILPLVRHERSGKEVCKGTDKRCETLQGCQVKKWNEWLRVAWSLLWVVFFRKNGDVKYTLNG